MYSESLFKPPVTSNIKAGKVVLSPNEEVGEHVTEKREEILVILRGTATLVIDGKSTEIKEGELYYINEGLNHNVINTQQEELEYVYIVGMHN
ncbi:MAG: cupin domain-containing protein [Candidatus Aenigmarchaeota archaeon]|nr:cupin domain-containing protein [Candidatus Aenigmarchaeota archaeon]